MTTTPEQLPDFLPGAPAPQAASTNAGVHDPFSPLALRAQLDEANYFIEQLRERNTSLNVTVRTRDAVIAQLRQQLAELDSLRGEVGALRAHLEGAHAVDAAERAADD